MEQQDILPLLTVYHRRLSMTSLRFTRFLHDKINLKSRLTGIRGSRGSGKTFDQIKDEPDSYLAIDDIETGAGNRIPLWMFGLLY